MQQNIVLVSAAIVFKRTKGLPLWLIVRPDKEESWEIVKAPVRRGESSVRTILRELGERGEMSVKVLEEAGRAGGAGVVNGKSVSQRFLYYLVTQTDEGGEVIGFAEHSWLEYSKAVRKLSSKRDQYMLKRANKLLKELDRKQMA